MPALTFPLNSSPGLEPQESGGRLINCYAEKLNDGRIIRRRVPGLRQLFDITGRSHCRGFLEVNGTLIVVLDDRVYTVTEASGIYTVLDRGALPGSGPVTLARNNKTPTPDIACVADGIAYVLSLSGAPANYPDNDVGSPNAVTSIDGYFVFTYGDARARSSGLNDTAINTLDYAFAESKPDGLFRPVSFRRELYLMGSGTIEVWRNTGNATGFPFSFLDTIPRGLAGPYAVAGFEDGWTNTLIWVGDDSIVYQLNGYTPTRISTHAVERMIEALEDKSDLQASVFMVSGHAFWALSSGAWTWVYDLTTGAWHERKSYGVSRWRGSQSVKAFGKWLVGDLASGKVFEAREDYYREGNDPIPVRLVTQSVGDFPNRTAATRLDLDLVAGTGAAAGLDPIETAPKVSISWSLDGGYTFTQPILREIGAQGRSMTRISVNRLGLIQPAGFCVAIECSDPVHFGVTGAHLDALPRAK